MFNIPNNFQIVRRLNEFGPYLPHAKFLRSSFDVSILQFQKTPDLLGQSISKR